MEQQTFIQLISENYQTSVQSELDMQHTATTACQYAAAPQLLVKTLLPDQHAQTRTTKRNPGHITHK
jgi:hypothetical protein